MKKILCFILAVVVFITPLYADDNVAKDTATSEKTVFTDVSDNYWAKDAIYKVYERGIINGYPDGTFKPNKLVTRAEFVAIVNRMMGYKYKKSKTSFKDVSKNHWAYDSIRIAERKGYIKGVGNNMFKPNGYITKAQVCTIITRTNKLTRRSYNKKPTDAIPKWAEKHVMTMLSNRLIGLDSNGRVNSDQYVTRAFIANVVSKLVVKNDKKAVSETIQKCKEVSKRLDVVMDLFKSDEQKKLARMIKTNLDAYVKNQKHDYKAAASVARKEYDKLSDEEKEEFQNTIIKYFDLNTLMLLRDKLL